MKKLVLGITLLASISAFASSTCESESYQKVVQDYAGECKELILNAAQDAGCSKTKQDDLKNNILAGNMIQLIDGSSTFCKIETEEGHYQVMTDDMPANPVATIFFSKYD